MTLPYCEACVVGSRLGLGYTYENSNVSSSAEIRLAQPLPISSHAHTQSRLVHKTIYWPFQNKPLVRCEPFSKDPEACLLSARAHACALVSGCSGYKPYVPPWGTTSLHAMTVHSLTHLVTPSLYHSSHISYIDLDLVVSVQEVSPAQQDKNHATFLVQCEGRTFQLQAHDETTMRK